MQLTNNFSLKEFYVSSKHRELADKLYDDRTEAQLDLLYNLATDLQKIRDSLPETIDRRIKITSGYRNPVLNNLVSNTKRSLHSRCLAVDYKMYGDQYYLNIIYSYIRKNIDYGEVYLYVDEHDNPTNIHYARQTGGYKCKHDILVRTCDGLVRREDYAKK